jgi:ubiquinone/menaquinone biosynthesis C-methylase UbiE/uncharacterized protein YbaR (Trm112 family)
MKITFSWIRRLSHKSFSIQSIGEEHMHSYIIEMLECPACHGILKWTVLKESENRIEFAEACCEACAAIYPVRDGIGLFLTPALQRNDLWEQMESGLMRHLREHPELERQLMETPLEKLSPADRFFRALVLEEQGNYTEAQIAADSADKDLYTPEHRECRDRQMEYVIERLSSTKGPIVDLASGKGYLVEQVVRKFKCNVVVSDFSPGILQANRKRLQSLGLYDHVSLLAFDARQTPFKDGAIPTMTTNLGLPNIEGPGNLLKELRRVVSGVFLAISQFFPEDDEINAKVIREAHLDPLLYRQSTLQQYEEAGWNVEVQNACLGKASPTPPGVLLEGARVDGLPVADTNLEWCVLLGTPGT